MNQILLIVVLALCLSAANSYAQGKPDKEMRQQNVEVREYAEDRAKDAREEAKERAEDAREEAEERTESSREHAKEVVESRGEHDEAAHGSEQAQEMRTRRDERKAIMNDAKESREAGQEGVGPDADAEDQPADQKEKAKKPWWKFWGD
jgi:hypothetical protein